MYIYIYINIYIYIYIYIYKIPTLNVRIETYINKKTHKIYSNYKHFSSFQKLCQCIIKL